jgi:hypothetical protein
VIYNRLERFSWIKEDARSRALRIIRRRWSGSGKRRESKWDGTGIGVLMRGIWERLSLGRMKDLCYDGNGDGLRVKEDTEI